MYARYASGPAVLLGLWLIVAPFLLGYELQTAVWVDVAAGLLIAGIGLVRVLNPLRLGGLSWLSFALGLWLVVMPIFFEFPGTDPAFWVNLMTGIFVAVLSAMSASEAFEIK